MRGAILLFVVFTLSLAAASLKLYTKDGGYQVVREYQVVGDRVRFYSLDRSDWEEVPASLIDLKRTATEAAAQQAALSKEDRQFNDEAAAERAEQEELAKIPRNPGVYRIEDGKLRTFPEGDFTVHTPKGNSALRALSPLPIFLGKATVELAGEQSKNIVSGERPEFYFQLDQPESFDLVKLTPKKGVRIAENIEIAPVTGETTETRVTVPTFTKQLPGDDFYKIWPQNSLPAGEYALMEYVDGQVRLRIFDFRVE